MFPPPRRCERETAHQAAAPIVLNVAPPIAEAPHETGVSCFVEVSKDSSRRESVRNFERAHCPPAPLIGRIASTRGSNFDANTRFKGISFGRKSTPGWSHELLYLAHSVKSAVAAR